LKKERLQNNLIYMPAWINFTILLTLVGLLLMLKYYIPVGILLLVAIVILVIDLSSSRSTIRRESELIERIAKRVEATANESIQNFPLAMVIMGTDGAVDWHNAHFSVITGESNCFNAQISELFPEINILRIIDDKMTEISFTINHKDRFYEIIGNVIKMKNKADSYSIVLYFIDRTVERDALNMCNDKSIASCILFIDNYEDLMKNTADANHAQLTTVIERSISGWAEENQTLLIKYEKDKYRLIMDNAHLQSQIENKFAFIEAIREIDEGNKIPVTISLGIGIDGISPAENDSFAMAAIEMALGRGGDQVVIKNSEKFQFFGGNSQEVEKRTKVKPRVVAHALNELIHHTEAIFIMGHKNADADVIGAAVGLASVIQRAEVKVYIVMDERETCQAKDLWDAFHDDPIYNEIFIDEEKALSFMTEDSLLIVVDTHRPSYVLSKDLLDMAEQIVLIDHHRMSAEFIQNAALVYHEPYASSASELVTEIIQYMEDNPQLSSLEAQALYSGIAVDTKNFVFKTGVRTFEAASFLRRMGVDTVQVKKLFQSDLEEYRRRSEIVSRAEIYNDNIAISQYESDDQNSNLLTSQAADELLNITGVQAAFVMCKTGEAVAISGRSISTVNVQMILEELGGGGHMMVAGAQVQGSLEEVAELLKKAIDNYIGEGEKA